MARSIANMSFASWLSRNGYPGYGESFARRVAKLYQDGYSIAMAISVAYDEV